MCGRYALYSEKKILSKFNIKIKKNFNISPNQNVLVINNAYSPKIINWGIKPEWMKSIIINARNETLFEKKIFSNLKRCVFIADGYFEWKRYNDGKTPFFHCIKNKLLYFAGLYDESGCCIVTKQSISYLSEVHKRQPYFLKENQIESWIKNADQNLIFDDIVLFYPVSNLVNRVWNNKPDLILEEIKDIH